MPEELRPHLLQFAAIGAGALALWFFWKLARAVVKWGFFVMYFVLGSLISLFLQPAPNIGVTLGGGLAFAWTVMAIKSKLWRLIGAVAIIAAMPFFSPVSKAIGKWTDPRASDEASAKKSPRPRQPAKSEGKSGSGIVKP